MVQSNDLRSIITNPTIRKVIYAAYVVLGVVLGATQVGFSAIEAGQPTWLTVALAVYAFLSVPLGSLALSNTPSNPTTTDTETTVPGGF